MTWKTCVSTDKTLTQSINQLKSIYFPSESKIDSELFLPLAAQADSIDCMVGYFTSNFLSELASTISIYLNSASTKKIRFIVSPNLDPSDLEKLQQAHEQGESYFSILFPNLHLKEDDLRWKCQAALALLVLQNRIQIKVALKKDGIFHTKCWIFNLGDKLAAIHGSSNATQGGLFSNFEQLVLSRSWLSHESSEICSKLTEKFIQIWNGSYHTIKTIELNKQTLIDIEKFSKKENAKQINDTKDYFQSILDISNKSPEHNSLTSKERLFIPPNVKYTDGDFSHQENAVIAWENNNNRGIIAVATGGGKTYTSLIAATRLQDTCQNLFVFIAVPTTTLLQQWINDVQDFGIIPINGIDSTTTELKQEIIAQNRMMRIAGPKTVVFLITHNLLTSGKINDHLEKLTLNHPILLIADEVHNLGSDASQVRLSESFMFRIGLSATYERQFDEDGTSFLLEYFGPVVHEFTLKDAIGKCLVPYNYYPHLVFLTADEQNEFEELTQEINRLAFAADESKDNMNRKRWEALCRQRRVLIEACSNKISELDIVFRKINYSLSKTLIFCTDKDPSQMLNVNQILTTNNVKFHQITQEETSKPKQLKQTLALFSKGDINVLTAKRVLDEGFNVPMTESAYLLASNTVRRQWVQRLGRILRKSESSGKKKAYLHDFIVIPITSGAVDKDLKSLLRTELNRVSFFSDLSSNYGDHDGGGPTISRMLKLMGAL